MRVNHRRTHISMTQQLLDRPDVITLLQQVGCKSAAEYGTWPAYQFRPEALLPSSPVALRFHADGACGGPRFPDRRSRWSPETPTASPPTGQSLVTCDRTRPAMRPTPTTP